MDEKNKISKKDTRQNFIDMLNEYFYVLTGFTRSIEMAQKKIEQAIEANQKIDRDYVLMINSNCTQILETITIILPLMKQNDAFPLIEEQKIDKEQIEGSEYIIKDPEQKKSIDELKGFVQGLLAKDDITGKLPYTDEQKTKLEKYLESANLDNSETIDSE